MVTYSALELDYCWWFDFDGYITLFVYNAPILIWYLVMYEAISTRDCYFQLLSSCYWIVSLVTLIIQELAQVSRPHPSCNNQGNANPSWEVAMIYGFITLMLFHRMYFLRALNLFDLLRGVFLAVVVPGWIILQGNYSVFQGAMGAVVGIVVGIFLAQWIYLFWIDRLLYVRLHRWLIKFGYKDSMPLWHWTLSQKDSADWKPFALLHAESLVPETAPGEVESGPILPVQSELPPTTAAAPQASQRTRKQKHLGPSLLDAFDAAVSRSSFE
jgi:hypothetical protein